MSWRGIWVMLFLLQSVAVLALASPFVHRLSQSAETKLLPTRTVPLQERSFRHGTSRSSPLQHITSISRGGATVSPTSLASTSFLETLDAAWTSHPFVAAAIVCGIKAFGADWVAQRRTRNLQASSQPSSFDTRRSLAFCIYGSCYQGLAQEFIYNTLYSTWFGTATTLRVVARKVLFDAVVHNACICIPMAYVVKAIVLRNMSFVQSIRQYIHDVRYQGLLWQYYAIWMPTNFVLYTYIPKQWRITCMATVSFFWMILLSTVASSSTPTSNGMKKKR